MAGIGDSWGTKEELLHPRGPDGRWIRKAGVPKGLISRILEALASFRPRMFQNQGQANQYLRNVGMRKPARFQGGRGYGRLLSDLGPTNEDLRDGVIDNPSTAKFIKMMDESATELPDDVILTRHVGVEAFGFTPQTAQGTSSDSDPGIRGMSGKLIADRGYSTTVAGEPRGAPPPGGVRMVIAARKGTKVIVPASGENDSTVFLDRDQSLRVTKIQPDGAGGWVMYAMTEEDSNSAPEPIGGPVGAGTRDSKQREAAIREVGRITATREARPDDAAEAADEAERRRKFEEGQQAIVPSPMQEAERRRVEQAQQDAGVQPRTEPIAARSIGGEPRPEAGAGAPEAPTGPQRAVDLRLAVRDAGIASPSAGPNRKRFNDAYEGIISGKKDPIDAVRELDRDAADLRAQGDADADNLEQLSELIKREFGLEARTKEGLPKVRKSQLQEMDERAKAAKATRAAKKAGSPPPTEAPPAPTPVKKAAKSGMTPDQEDRVVARAQEFRGKERNDEERRIVGQADDILASRRGEEPAKALPPVAKKAPAKMAAPAELTPEERIKGLFNGKRPTNAQLREMGERNNLGFGPKEPRSEMILAILGARPRRGQQPGELTPDEVASKAAVRKAVKKAGPSIQESDAEQLRRDHEALVRSAAPEITGRRVVGQAPAKKAAPTGKPELAEIKAWAKENGYEGRPGGWIYDKNGKAIAHGWEDFARDPAIAARIKAARREGSPEAPGDDLDKMTKQQLLDEAARREVEVPKSWTKDRIKSLLREEQFRKPEKKTPEQRREIRRTDQTLERQFQEREAAGEAVPQPDTGPAPVKKTAKVGARRVDLDSVERRLGTEIKTDDAAVKLLSNPFITMTDLRRIAEDLNVDVPKSRATSTGARKPWTKETLVRHIAESVIGNRRRTEPGFSLPEAPAPAKKAAKALLPVGAPGVLERLQEFDNPMSREDAQALLTRSSRAQLLEMAKELSIPGASKKTMPELRREIVEATVGRRLDSIATRGFRGERPGEGDLGGRPDLPRGPAAPAKAAVPEAAPGTAAGKITAGRLQPGMRVLVSQNNSGDWVPSTRKTGQTSLTIEGIGQAPGRSGMRRTTTRLVLTGRDENGNQIQVASVPGHQTFIVAPEPGAAPAKKAAKVIRAPEVFHDYSPFLEKSGVADSELNDNHRVTLQEIADRLNEGTPGVILARDLRAQNDPILTRVANGVESPDLMRGSPAKKAAKAAAPKRMTIGEARRLSAMEAIRANEVTGNESNSWKTILSRVDGGNWSVARARQEAKSSARYWRDGAATVRRGAGRSDPKKVEEAASRLERAADQYDKLAEDLTISQSVTKTDKFMRGDAPDKVELARERQRRLDRARGYGNLTTEIDELLNNEASDRALGHSIITRSKVEKSKLNDESVIDPVDIEELTEAVKSGDRDRVRAIARRLQEREGITQIESTGTVVPYDPKRHRLLGEERFRGRELPRFVTVSRPGSRVNDNGEDLLIERATVQEATDTEIAGVEIGARGASRVPDGSVKGDRPQTPIDNQPRKREFDDAWDAADLEPDSPAGRSLKEIKDDVASGKITPEEGIRRIEGEIAFNQEDLNEVDASLREDDLTPAQKTRLQSDAAKLQGAIDAHKKASKFMRLYFKDEKPTVKEVEVSLDEEGFRALQEATPESLREAAKIAGMDPPKGNTKEEILQDMVRQVAEKVARERGIVPKKAAKKAVKKAAPEPPKIPTDRERVDARLLAEGIDGLDEKDIAEVQRALDGDAVPGSGKNPTPSRISQWVDFKADGVSSSTVIQHGNWGDPHADFPEREAERQRTYDQGMARVQALREYAERIRGVRRRKATPAKKAVPEVQAAETRADSAEARLINDHLERVHAAKSRAQGNAALEGLTMPELRRIGEQMGIKGRSKGEMRDKILDRFFPETPTPEAQADLEVRQQAALDRLRRLPPPRAAAKAAPPSVAEPPEAPIPTVRTKSPSPARRAREQGIVPPDRAFSDVEAGITRADQMSQQGASKTEIARMLRERAAVAAKADLNEEGRRFMVEQDNDTLRSIRKSGAEYLRRLATMLQQEEKKERPAKKAAPSAPSPSRTGTSPVGGTKSQAPEIPNRWGAMGTGGEVEFHPDGVVGNGIKDLGEDRLIDVDGEPLSTKLGRLVTRMNHGEISMDQLIDELNRLAQRLPEGSKARRIVQQMGPALDAPKVKIDIPEGTPEVLSKLARAMADNPLARGAVDRPGFSRDAENSELAKVMKMIEDFNAGRLSGLRMIGELQSIRSGVPHEANEGNAPILRALAEAAQMVRAIMEDPKTRGLLARRALRASLLRS